MQKGHGEYRRFMVGGDLFLEPLDLKAGLRITDPFGLGTAPDIPYANSEPVFRLGRMFRRPNLPEYRPEACALIELGVAMEEQGELSPDPDTPAGYTFLGQFIDHDLSFAQTERLPTNEAMEAEAETSLRTPSLDLDSLYGSAPELLRQSALGKLVYEDDGVRLRVGQTQGDPFVDHPKAQEAYPNDLPRGVDPAKLQTAAIIDPRNDDNLAVAQTHLAFIKFHNAVVKQLSGTVAEGEVFAAAREKVVRHYQWIILKDYLPRIIEPEVLDDVVEKGCRHFELGVGEEPFIPFEFSVAAYRLGHSQIRGTYEWNRFFRSRPPHSQAATLRDLFNFTGFGEKNLLGQNHLQSSWVVDWTRFYDFTGFPGAGSKPSHNRTRRIDTSVTSPLMVLPPVPGLETLPPSLSVRNLLRGRFLGLPTGQCVAERLGAEPLAPEKIACGPHGHILKEFGLHRLTPLWYYILKEAEEYHAGSSLGPVGSRIVAETFVRLIKSSRVSILPKGSTGGPTWEPDLGTEPRKFSMPDLLYFVHRSFEEENYLNPLGDEANERIVRQFAGVHAVRR